MKVGELRKQGWTAIQGDVIQGTFRMRLSEVAAIAINKGINDHCEVIELAWRSLEMPYENINMPLEFTVGGYWRPYLSLTFREYKPAVAIDEKPVFTQAMADAGELPPVGAIVTLDVEKKGKAKDLNFQDHSIIESWGKGVEVEVIAHTLINDLLLPVVKFRDEVSAVMMRCIKPLDNRTEKEKVVDAAFLAFNVDKPTLEAIYDLWRQAVEQ